MARLPIPGSDKGNWGAILNEYLLESHDEHGLLKSNIVSTNSIQGGAITEAKLDAATQAKLNTVSTGVADGAITNVKVAANAAIAQSKIANLTTDLAGKASTTHTHGTADIQDGAITEVKLDSATQTKLNAVSSGVQDGSITDAKIASSAAIAQSKIANLTTDLAGKASTTHAHAASAITSGVIATARLGTGTANGVTFLRGDGTWATPDGGSGGGGGGAYDLGRVRYDSGWPTTRPSGYAYIDWIKSSPSDPDPSSSLMVAGDTISEWQ